MRWHWELENAVHEAHLGQRDPAMEQRNRREDVVQRTRQHVPVTIHEEGRSLRRGVCARLVLAAIANLCAVASNAHADILGNAYYDPRRDELVVTMFYRGTNSDHDFSLKWGTCHQSPNGKVSSVSAQVLDDQWQDVEQHDYAKTTRFGLATLTCRPAHVTLHTAPHFFYEVFVPSAHR